MSTDKLYDIIEKKILGVRTSNEIQCFEYIKELKGILEKYKRRYIVKRNSATFKKITRVEQKINSFLDFYHHDIFAGSFLVIQFFEKKISVEDILHTIVMPRMTVGVDGVTEEAKERMRRETVNDAATAFNILSAVCEYANAIKQDNKIESLFKVFNINGNTESAKQYVNQLNSQIHGLDLEAQVKEEEA